MSKKMLIHHGFLEIVNEKVEQNSQDLVEATPIEYSNQDLSLHNKKNTNKNSSNNPLHSGKNIPKFCSILNFTLIKN